MAAFSMDPHAIYAKMPSTTAKWRDNGDAQARRDVARAHAGPRGLGQKERSIRCAEGPGRGRDLGGR
jgi:hypothetical protein